jgi:glycosyltransferase involved in cell wall biosynthesis
LTRPEPAGGAERPLISVVVPSYQHVRFVERAIRSVVAQTYRPLELVVVDDGSTDGSVERLRDLRNRLRADAGGAPLAGFTLLEQSNQGADRALARGIEASRGEAVAILNSDDVYHPRRLELLEPLLRLHGGLVFSGVDFIDEANAPLSEEHGWRRWYGDGVRLAESLPTESFALLLRNFSVTSSNFLFPRALYDRLGGFSDHRFAHDWDFLLRSIYFREPARLGAALLSYRVHPDNTTERVRHRLVEESLGALRRYVSLFAGEPSPNLRAPWRDNWPDYFPRFAAAHAPAFSEQSLGEVLESL